MRPGLRLAPLGGVATLALAVTACAWSLPPLGGGAPGGPTPEAIELRASRARNARLEREVERLRADVREAEDTLVAIESGMRGGHTRADAVMALAEARIEVGRVAQQAPWAPQSVKDAQTLLEEADRHIRAERFGAAIFFTSRARRASASS